MKSYFTGECSSINKLPPIQLINSIQLPLIQPVHSLLAPIIHTSYFCSILEMESSSRSSQVCCNLAPFIGLVSQEKDAASFGAYGQCPETVATVSHQKSTSLAAGGMSALILRVMWAVLPTSMTETTFSSTYEAEESRDQDLRP